MSKRKLRAKNIYKLLSKDSKSNLANKVNDSLRRRRPFKIEVRDKTYDLTPLMAFVVGGNIYKKYYFDTKYVEALIIKMIVDYVEKDAYPKSPICQKSGLIKPYGDSWSKCLEEVFEGLFEFKVWDYTTILHTLLNYNPWDYKEFPRYYMSFLSTIYFRGLEEKRIVDSCVLFNLIDMFVMGDMSDYYKDYEEGNIKFNSTRGLEFIFINFFNYYLFERDADEKTLNFIDNFTKDITLCKFLKFFEVDDYGQSRRRCNTSNSTSELNVNDKLYSGNYDYGSEVINKENDTLYSYCNHIMRFTDDFLYSRLNSEFQFCERKDIVDVRYTIEATKDSEIKKLTNDVKKLHKSIESYKSAEAKTCDTLKNLRIQASKNTNNDIIQSKDKEIEELKRTLGEKDSELTKVNNKLKSYKNRVDTLESKEIKVNEDAQITIKELEDDIHNLETACKYYELTLNESTNKSFDDYKKAIEDLKVCVIGGPNGYEKRLECISKNFVHVNTKECNYAYDLPQCDVIVANSSIISHSHEITARRIAKSRGIPFLRTQVTNIELLAKILYQFKLML